MNLKAEQRIGLEPQNGEHKETGRWEIVRALQDAGVERHWVSGLMMKRLELLHELTPTFDDEARIARLGVLVNSARRERGSKEAMSQEKMADFFAGNFFTDIGKTGPRDATPEQARAVAEVYAIDVRVDNSVTLQEFLDRFFPSRVEEMRMALTSIEGLDAQMTMRSLYDLHVHWSYEIIKNSELPANAKIAAASHHILEGNFPSEVLTVAGRVVLPGHERFLDERDVLVLLLDQYDAQRRRARRSHDQAIEYLHSRTDGPEFMALDVSVQVHIARGIEDINRALKDYPYDWEVNEQSQEQLAAK